MSTSLSPAVLIAFDFAPDCLLEPFGQGHINRTFRLTEPDGSRYILQRINTSVFPDPAALMQNIQRVTAYLSRRILLEGGDPL
ncbi:MAG: mucin desulfatase, partial [Acutalibacteraceae bacterium]